jgi:hypothetical protein
MYAGAVRILHPRTHTITREGGCMAVTGWSDIATFSSGFEADLATAQLEAAGITAVSDSNDTVGIFGPGFQGATGRGVTVRLPDASLDEARAVLSVDRETER